MGYLIDLNPPKPIADADLPASIARDGESQIFTPPARIVGISTGGVATLDNTYANKCGIEVRAQDASSAAYMSFHRLNSYAVHVGLDTNNQLSVGGWSLGNVSYRILHEGVPISAKAPLPTANVAGNSTVTSWNSVQSGQGISEFCNYAGLGGGDAFNFFRIGGNAPSAPTISNRVARIDISGGYLQTSDRRLKQKFSASPGLAEILALSPQRYEHYECVGFDEKEKKLKLGKNFVKKVGFVAQDVQKILPEAVNLTDSDEELYGIDISCIVATLVRAVQEQQQQIDELRARLPAVK